MISIVNQQGKQTVCIFIACRYETAICDGALTNLWAKCLRGVLHNVTNLHN